jgi:hypothetical protein
MNGSNQIKQFKLREKEENTMGSKLQEKKDDVQAHKEPYEPPKAAFIPLKIEERLMACAKISNSGICSTNRNKS